MKPRLQWVFQSRLEPGDHHGVWRARVDDSPAGRTFFGPWREGAWTAGRDLEGLRNTAWIVKQKGLRSERQRQPDLDRVPAPRR